MIKSIWILCFFSGIDIKSQCCRGEVGCGLPVTMFVFVLSPARKNEVGVFLFEEK